MYIKKQNTGQKNAGTSPNGTTGISATPINNYTLTGQIDKYKFRKKQK